MNIGILITKNYNSINFNLYILFFNLASLLLDSLLSYLASADRHTCKCVYLHVLTSNTAAIRFYERRNFRMHTFLPYYYSIQGTPRDGYSYVLYVNGGQPPWTILYPFKKCRICIYFILFIFKCIMQIIYMQRFDNVINQEPVHNVHSW